MEAITLFDVIGESKHKCKECKHFYRKQWHNGKSWGKCELGRGGYDCKANQPACTVFERE